MKFTVTILILAVLMISLVLDAESKSKESSSESKSKSKSSSSESKSKSKSASSSGSSEDDSGAFDQSFMKNCIRRKYGAYNGRLGKCKVKTSKAGKNQYKFKITCTKTVLSDGGKRKCSQKYQCTKMVKYHKGKYSVTKESCKNVGKEVCHCLECKRRGRWGEKCQWKKCPKTTTTPSPPPVCAVRDQPIEGCDGLLNSVKECIKQAAQNVQNIPDTEILDIRPLAACLQNFNELIDSISLPEDSLQLLGERFNAYLDFNQADIQNLQKGVDSLAQISQIFPNYADVINELIENTQESVPAIVIPSIPEYSGSIPTYSEPNACDANLQANCETTESCLYEGPVPIVLDALSEVKSDCMGVDSVPESIDSILSYSVAFLESLIVDELSSEEIDFYMNVIEVVEDFLPDDFVVPPELQSIAL